MKNSLITGIIVLIVAAIVAFGVAKSVTPASPASTQKFGSLAGPTIPSPYINYGGVSEWNVLSQMQVGTTTICAFQSPAATSTIDAVFYTISTGTSTSALIDLATSTNAFATTTNLVTGSSFGSNANGSVVYQSSGTAGLIAPNTWIVAKTQGAGLGGYTYGGTCGGAFIQIAY